VAIAERGHHIRVPVVVGGHSLGHAEYAGLRFLAPGRVSNLSQPFVLTNTGTENCVLQGYPTRLQGWQDGRWQQMNFTQGTYFIQEDPSPGPVELAPAAQAELIIGTEDACRTRQPSN